jgi:hypothetical protein
VVVAAVVVATASEAAAVADADPPPLSQAVSSRADAESATVKNWTSARPGSSSGPS